MTTNQQAVDAADAVTKARAALDELLRIERLLETELPAARSALQAAEKKLREATKPDRSAIRAHELATLKRKLEEAKEND